MGANTPSAPPPRTSNEPIKKAEGKKSTPMYKAYPESQVPISTTSRSKDKVASLDPSWTNWGSPPNGSTEDAQSVDWSSWCMESGSQGAPTGERVVSAVAQCSPLPGSSSQTKGNL
eukprot:1263733-Prorocentrum_lima.AAC.1